MLTLEQILKADDRTPRVVPVPEWGGDVNVYPLTSSQIEEMERWNDANPSGYGYRVKLLSLALSDLSFDAGTLLELNKKSGAVIRRLVSIAEEMAVPSAENVEGNSDAGSDAGNGSD